jgi:integrase
MSLGRVEDFKTLDDARTKASGYLQALREDGTDPMAARERMADAETLTALWEVYEREHVAALSQNTIRAMSSVWKAHVEPVLGQLSPGQITKQDVLRIHDRATKNGKRVAANRAVQRLRSALNWLHDRNPRQFPEHWKNPCSVKLNKETERKEILDLAQQQQLVAALADEPDPFVRTYLTLLLLTGLRSVELISLKWSGVNYARATALIGQRKNGEDLLIPLPPIAVELLRALPVVAGEADFVFPSSRRSGQPLTTNMVRRRYSAALERAGLPHRTLHDLRRSFGTNVARGGASTRQIASLLGNTEEITARVYVQLAADDLRRLSETNATALLPAPRS